MLYFVSNECEQIERQQFIDADVREVPLGKMKHLALRDMETLIANSCGKGMHRVTDTAALMLHRDRQFDW